MKKLLVLTVIIGLTLAISGISTVPPLLNYQGLLTDSLGDGINDTVSIEFNIYDAASGGSSKWTETHSSVIVQDGLFSVLLGSITPVHDTVFTKSSNRWLGIAVDGDPEISPRSQIASVGYAINADYVDGQHGATTGDGLTRKRQVNEGTGGGVDTIVYDHLQAFIVTLAEHSGAPGLDAVGYAFCIENDGHLTWIGVNGDGSQSKGRALSNVIDTILTVEGNDAVLETAGDGHSHRLILRSTTHCRVTLIYH